MYIKRNGKYFLEDLRCYHLVPNKEDATEVIDFQDAESFIKYDMELKLHQVSLEDENGVIYRNYNGVWYNHDDQYVCSRCGKIDDNKNANYINSIDGKQEICYQCYDKLDIDKFEDVSLDEYNKQ